MGRILTTRITTISCYFNFPLVWIAIHNTYALMLGGGGRGEDVASTILNQSIGIKKIKKIPILYIVPKCFHPPPW